MWREKSEGPIGYFNILHYPAFVRIFPMRRSTDAFLYIHFYLAYETNTSIGFIARQGELRVEKKGGEDGSRIGEGGKRAEGGRREGE